MVVLPGETGERKQRLVMYRDVASQVKPKSTFQINKQCYVFMHMAQIVMLSIRLINKGFITDINLDVVTE